MANYDYIISQGVIVPDTAQIRADVEAEYRAALGADLVVTPDTPEGALISAEVSSRDAMVRNNAKIANQINPNYAGGTFLDALWALMGGEREGTSSSTAVCLVTGVAGAIVNTATRFRTNSNTVWAVTAQTTIGADGTALVPVRCTTPGPIGAAANTITSILVPALGLETVTNPNAAILGTITQSDPSARIERRRTLGLQGATLSSAIMANVYMVPGVRSMSFRENWEGTPKTIDDVTLPAHSMYACVDGGEDYNVAFSLLVKSLGCNWVGNQAVNVTDPSSGQVYPVKFSRPAMVQIMVRVTVAEGSPLIDVQSAVRQAIMAYQNGEIENEEGFIVGADVSPFELAGAINIMFPQIFVRKVELAIYSGSPAFSTNDIEIYISQKAFVTESSITVVTV